MGPGSQTEQDWASQRTVVQHETYLPDRGIFLVFLKIAGVLPAWGNARLWGSVRYVPEECPFAWAAIVSGGQPCPGRRTCPSQGL